MKKILVSTIALFTVTFAGTTSITSADSNEGSTTRLRQKHGLISLGKEHSCAVVEGAVKCWGRDNDGQLGNGSATTSRQVNPVTATGISNATAVAAGFNHTCALLADQTIKCWGNGGSGRLGSGNTAPSDEPIAVTGISNAIAVSAGGEHTCAVLAGGGVKCWGANADGQLGNGDSGPSAEQDSPVAVTGISDAIAVTAGGRHTCALLSDKTIKCWGTNQYGQLGNGSSGVNLISNVPVSVSNITNAAAVSAGYDYTCAVLESGTAQCWGINSFGQLGKGDRTIDGGPNNDSNIPANVSNLTNAVSVTTHYFHSCAVTSTSEIKCWGLNGRGRLGDNTTTDSLVPVAVVSAGISNLSIQSSVVAVTNARAVSVGEYHSCAIISTRIACWGTNGNGQIGSAPYGSIPNSDGDPYYKTVATVIDDSSLQIPESPQEEQEQNPAPVVTTTVAPAATTTTVSKVKKLSKLPETGSSNSLLLFAAITVALGGAVTVLRKRVTQ